jgi:lipoyl(octanoyl) transferase
LRAVATAFAPLTGAPLAIERLPLGTGGSKYSSVWALQRQIHAQVVSGDRRDTLLLLEHEQVYTAGSRTEPADLPTDGSHVIEVDRGGRITWHGPGQLVGYPIVSLPHKLDVLAYVRAVEDLIITALARFGVSGCRVSERSGVWVSDSTRNPNGCKVAAIGVRVSRGVTMHGFAINADCELGWADKIGPCGIADAGVTSISVESGKPTSVGMVADQIEDILETSTQGSLQ